jgi:hypothetical protein
MPATRRGDTGAPAHIHLDGLCRRIDLSSRSRRRPTCR